MTPGLQSLCTILTFSSLAAILSHWALVVLPPSVGLSSAVIFTVKNLVSHPRTRNYMHCLQVFVFVFSEGGMTVFAVRPMLLYLGV